MCSWLGMEGLSHFCGVAEEACWHGVQAQLDVGNLAGHSYLLPSNEEVVFFGCFDPLFILMIP